IGSVASIPWYQVDMKMQHCLARRLAVIHSNVETVRLVLALDGKSCLVEAGEEFSSLGRRRLEEGADVPAWDDQRVAKRRRERVTKDEYEFALVEYAPRVRVAKRAQVSQCEHRPRGLPTWIARTSSAKVAHWRSAHEPDYRSAPENSSRVPVKKISVGPQ